MSRIIFLVKVILLEKVRDYFGEKELVINFVKCRVGIVILHITINAVFFEVYFS